MNNKLLVISFLSLFLVGCPSTPKPPVVRKYIKLPSKPYRPKYIKPQINKEDKTVTLPLDDAVDSQGIKRSGFAALIKEVLEVRRWVDIAVVLIKKNTTAILLPAEPKRKLYEIGKPDPGKDTITISISMYKEITDEILISRKWIDEVYSLIREIQNPRKTRDPPK